MFCDVKGLEALGIGKIVDDSGAIWTVEYFDAPGNLGRRTHRVAKSRVEKKTLGPNTRIYYHNETTERWLVGRVLEHFADSVLVRFPNRSDVEFETAQVFVRWKRPIEDPVVYLANGLTETPHYATARSEFLDSYMAQRGASWGISALLSSAIELEPHQINVIRRVLNDASQRYLLADEVGLGKTIEAGVIIRQAVLDDPEAHRVVVLVPPNLVPQWRKELVRKFGLGAFLDDSVLLFPQELSNGLETALTSATLLVIDEAHHLASCSDEVTKELYRVVRVSAPRIQRLILLSATPVLRNETGFLRLLHLLDPVVYNLNDEVAFRAKIIHRQALAEAVASLDPQNVLQLDWILDDLLGKLPDDARLAMLVKDLQEQLVALPDEDDPVLNDSIRLLKAHLSETYRLHRRILRNRRKQIKGLTPDRKGAQLCLVPVHNTLQLEAAIEAWRLNALAAIYGTTASPAKMEFTAFFLEIVTALIESPTDVKTICGVRQTRLNELPDRLKNSFEGEDGLLASIGALVDYQDFIDARLNGLLQNLRQWEGRRTKAVIFCSNKQVADTVFAHLHQELRETVVRHERSQDDEQDAHWLKFLSSSTVNVIVCDSTAEEGLNLQGGDKVIVHFDLPLSPNRIEQRIGRLDRYGSGNPIQSVVMMDEDSKFQRIWYTLLEHGLGVFDRSIASLQYLVEDELHKLGEVLFIDGYEGLESLASRLGGPAGTVAAELKLIDQQDGLDELTVIGEQETGPVEEVDADWKNIRQAFFSWAVDTLMFAEIPVPEFQTGIDPSFRFQYRKPGTRGSTTLIPLSGFLYDFIGALDFEAMDNNSRQPRTHVYSARRNAAVNRGIRVLRYGDAFVEAVKSFSDLDDRGRSFAMWRRMETEFTYDKFQMYFRLDFVIECGTDDATEVLAHSLTHKTKAAQSAILRRGDALFPPSVERVWVDEDGEEPTSQFIQRFLLPKYSKDPTGPYLDTNLNSERFETLAQALPETFANWGERCARIRDQAHNILVSRQEFENRKGVAIARAREEDDVRYAQLTTRIQRLVGVEAETERAQLALETALYAALQRGIANPSIRVDVVGVVFLSRLSIAELQQHARTTA